MMKVITLSSSSRGNSVLVLGEKTNLLIDAGINVTTLVEKLKVLNVDPNSIMAILSTHEHSDHTKGIGPFIRKYGAKLYVKQEGKEALLKKVGNINLAKVVEFFDTDFCVGEFNITSFKLPHDATSCVGFKISNGTSAFAYATDLGFATPETINYLKNCKLVILESNHDEKMVVSNPSYPDALKRRILSKHGHLSNMASAKVVCELAVNNVKQVVLAHLSLDNNDPKLAFDTHCSYLLAQGITPGVNIKIDVAPAFNLGTLFKIN